MSRFDDDVFRSDQLRRRKPLYSRNLVSKQSELERFAPNALSMAPLLMAMNTAAYCLAYAMNMLVTPHIRQEQQVQALSLRGVAHFGYIAVFAMGAVSLFMQRRRLYRSYERDWIGSNRSGLYPEDHRHELVRQQRYYQLGTAAAFVLMAVAHSTATERLFEATPLLMQLGLMAGLMLLGSEWVNDMQLISWSNTTPRFC